MKIFRKTKDEFDRVHQELIWLTNKKVPKWVTLIWFTIMLPVGLALYPLVKLWYYLRFKWIIRKIKDRA